MPTWSALPPAFLKFNTDASYDHVFGKASMVVLLRDCRGELLHGCWFSSPTSSAAAAEGLALLAAVSLAKYIGLSCVLFAAVSLVKYIGISCALF